MDFNLTKELAYTLGFLWADGNLYEYKSHHRICIEIIKEDMDIVKNTFYKSGIPWGSNSTRQRKNWKPQSYLGCSNIEWFSLLKELGYKDKESPEKVISLFPDDLAHYWFLGLSDGDGCFYINYKQYIRQYSIASEYGDEFKYFVNLCKRLEINYSIYNGISKKGHKHSALRLTNGRDCSLFGNYIYENFEIDKIGLKRKYDKFMLIKEMIK